MEESSDQPKPASGDFAWGICPICEQRCSNGATIHYNCWRASFGWDSDELRAQVRKHNALPLPKAVLAKVKEGK